MSDSPTEAAPPCSRWISGQDARDLVAEGAVLLDVRTPEEHAEGHLEGSVNIPVDEIASRLSELDPQRHVVVYCGSGRRAHRAAGILEQNGRQVSEIGKMSQYDPEAPAGCGD